MLLLLACVRLPEPVQGACGAGECVSPDAPGDGPVHALLINGGASPEHNYESHLQHLREMRGALLDRGLTSQDIDVFCSDGGDDAADMTTLNLPEAAFLLEGTPGEALVAPSLVDTDWDVPMRPATRSALDSWFRREGTHLHAGQTLFVYATDHGTEEGLNLWGEQLTPGELRRMASLLDPGVRMVTVMSQCHSGTFAQALPSGVPDGRSCGFYSVPRDLVAYGCYAGGHQDRIGHGFRFVDAFGGAVTLADAQQAVVLSDDSPDVPVSTSDLYLERLLRDRAERVRGNLEGVVHALLPDGYEDETTRALAARFGTPLLRTLADVEAERERADRAEGGLEQASEAWNGLLEDANRANLLRLTRTDTGWADRIAEGLLDDDAAKRDALRDTLVLALAAQADSDGAWADLASLQERRDEVDDARWRELTRRRVADRAARAILRAAGERLLEDPALAKEAEGYRALQACEATAIGTPSGKTVAPATAWPSPTPDEAERLAPRWLGVRLGDVEPSRIEAVLPGGPAAEAGVQAGDRLRSVGGRAVHRRGDIVNQIALASPGETLTLELDRGEDRLRIDLVPTARPAN